MMFYNKVCRIFLSAKLSRYVGKHYLNTYRGAHQGSSTGTGTNGTTPLTVYLVSAKLNLTIHTSQLGNIQCSATTRQIELVVNHENGKVLPVHRYVYNNASKQRQGECIVLMSQTRGR